MKLNFVTQLCIVAQIISLVHSMSMRNVNGQCMATFCWNGLEVDPFDCWCPDPPGTNSTNSNSSATRTSSITLPVCKQ